MDYIKNINKTEVREMKIVITNPTMALSSWIKSKDGNTVFEAEKNFDGTAFYLTDYDDMIIFSFECEVLN